MSFRIWISLAAAATTMLAAGCASSPQVGTGNERYLVATDNGMVYVQLETVSAQACQRLKMSLQQRALAASSQQLNCESVDNSENLPYSLSGRDETGVFRVATFNQNQCRGWASFIASTTGATVGQGACPDTPQHAGGKRYFQVSDEHEAVYVQMDFGTEVNCLQFLKAREATSGRAQGHARFACSNDARNRELRYSATVVAEGRPPVLGIEVRDKGICEMMLRGTASQYPGYRPECRPN